MQDEYNIKENIYLMYPSSRICGEGRVEVYYLRDHRGGTIRRISFREGRGKRGY